MDCCRKHPPLALLSKRKSSRDFFALSQFLAIAVVKRTRVIFCWGLMIIAAFAGLAARGQTIKSFQLTGLGENGAGSQLTWTSGGTGVVYTVQFQDSVLDGIWRIPNVSYPSAGTVWVAPFSTNS